MVFRTGAFRGRELGLTGHKSSRRIGQKVGWELLERLNADASTEQIPVLVVSIDPAFLARAEEQASRYGRSRFLNKPFDLEAVLEAVHELIGPASQSRPASPTAGLTYAYGSSSHGDCRDEFDAGRCTRSRLSLPDAR